MLSKRILALVGSWLIACGTVTAQGQSINIDYATQFGTPTNAYGAAAGLPGVWNNPAAGTTAPQSLVNLAGGTTTARIAMQAANPAFSFNNPGTTGDDERLMDDLLDLGAQGSADTFRIFGLQPGTYWLYTYAWAPDNATFITSVNVNGTGAQMVGGVWPGGHVLGTTYALHLPIVITSPTEQITINTVAASGFGSINGFQLRKTTDLAAVALATPNSLPPSSVTLLTVQVFPAEDPASTGIAVTGNLTAIGGPASQTFFDNGTNGDVTAGDNTFSFSATVGAAILPGPKSLPVSVTDAQGRSVNPTIQLTIAIVDCNSNNVHDAFDIAEGTSADCNTNATPDECDPGFGIDCDQSGTMDICQANWLDCNANGNLDSCDVNPATALSDDCNANGTPDECEGGCNTNGVPDQCDIAGGTAFDCNTNGTPDLCETDCNANGIADECDVAAGGSGDCNSNNVPDECEDCNTNGTADECDLTAGASPDCNANGTIDECDTLLGYVLDDGVSENAVGLTAGGLMTWLNAFQALPGKEIVQAIDVAYGIIPNGTPATVHLWIDPNNDGNPTNAVLAASANTTVQAADTDTFIRVPIPAVNVGSAGSWFFVGVILNHGVDDFPAAIDQTVSQMRSWVVVGGDPNNLSTASLIDDNGIPGNWMIRAEYHPDCNANDVLDPCDIAGGASDDENANAVPDECEIDCNTNNTPDADEPNYVDCNNNLRLDLCDLTFGTSQDCDGNGTPDECAGDCNTNGTPDPCETGGNDVNANDVPDECEFDCNANGTPDSYEVSQGAPDCNANGIPDDCEVPATAGPADDCADAAFITSGVVYSGNTYVGAPTPGGPAGCAESAAQRDHYFKYKPLTSGTITLSMCSLNGYDASLALYDGCPATDPPLFCDDDGCCPGDVGCTSLIEDFGVTAGITYIIRVTGFPNPDQGPFGPYELILTGPAGAGDENANGVPDECEVECACPGDMNASGAVDGDDIPCYVACLLGMPGSCNCSCGGQTVNDFVQTLVTGGGCP